MRSQKTGEKQVIKSYKDLEVYQEGYSLAIRVYQEVNKLPGEALELAKQTRRAAISIPLNIVRVTGRKNLLLNLKDTYAWRLVLRTK